MKITRLGHAMYLLTSPMGKNYLIDPFFDLNPGCPQEYNTEEFFSTVDAVFLTHGHFDHTSGLQKMIDVQPQLLVVAPYELAMILLQKGIQHVFPLNLGGSIELEDVHVTMVPAKHSSSFGETEGPPIYAGEASGYVFEFTDGPTLYHSGDTALSYDIQLINELYKPTIAILSSSGQFTMGPREAAYAVRNFLDVDIVIPSHTFPTAETATSTEIYEQLIGAFPVVKFMVDRDHELEELLKDYDRTEVIALGFGEQYEFRSNKDSTSPN
ncbi:metal-dependent hydrolase [Sporosarcina sp. GW1-11]|uniref:metal-dependent hydrolase n=1 Tax=Sporosarcina sp. GW1-11 TaxID=2899126 RepID=UPI00294E5D0C|nr:metal-dependent hydrolase [Sporosarcina sp. GW1-11]MDV6377157.1 metal-dependent hydrolase [Sporosarcina sp. GW1-11]